MGLLDDAIRQHLDLKRSRGADPTEVERDEREALGPVRRAPEASPSAELAGDPGLDEPSLAYDREEEASWSHESLEDEDPADSHAGQELASEPRFEDDDPFAEREPPVPVPDPLEPSPQPEPHPASPPPHPAGEETIEYDVEEALGSKAHREEGDDEDVLEETPEFLQDTPDHDRLWFEQRPPKDFDFEG